MYHIPNTALHRCTITPLHHYTVYLLQKISNTPFIHNTVFMASLHHILIISHTSHIKHQLHHVTITPILITLHSIVTHITPYNHCTISITSYTHYIIHHIPVESYIQDIIMLTRCNVYIAWWSNWCNAMTVWCDAQCVRGAEYH